MLAKDPQERGDLQDEVILEFPKPSDSKTAKLIFHSCNSPWSMSMSNRLMSLLGSRASDWLDVAGSDSTRLQRLKGYLKEQALHQFEVYVWQDNAWQSHEYVWGASPTVPQQRLLPLDISHLDEEGLRVKLRLGAGFWMLDNVMVDYSDDVRVTSTDVVISQAADHQGQDLCGVLRYDDDEFYVMPEIGDYAMLEFEEPPEAQGMARSVILKTKGYYEIHQSDGASPDIALLMDLLSKPYALNRYSLVSFQEAFGYESNVGPTGGLAR
jgi:hypothetical protein